MDRVLDRLTYTSHPHNAGLFMAEAEEEMDRLMTAEVAMDGGRDQS